MSDSFLLPLLAYGIFCSMVGHWFGWHYGFSAAKKKYSREDAWTT